MSLQPQEFRGSWALGVVDLPAGGRMRFTVRGSSNADGTYPGVVGTVVSVQGGLWAVQIQVNYGGGWTVSETKRSPTVLGPSGPMLTVTAYDLAVEVAPTESYELETLILNATTDDPALAPPQVSDWPPVFSAPVGEG